MMEAEGRGGYLERVPTLDILVDHLRQHDPLFARARHIPMQFDKRVEGNTSIVPSFLRDANGQRCDGPKSNIQSFFWPFYYQNEHMFNASWDEEFTVIMASVCADAVIELAYAVSGIDAPMLIVNPDIRLANVQRFPNVLNIFSMPDITFVDTLTTMAHKYSWSSITVLCTSAPEMRMLFYTLMCSALPSHLARLKSSVKAFIHSFPVNLKSNRSEQFAEALVVAKKRRVTVLLFPPALTRRFMVAALDAGLINGDYIFVVFEIVAVPVNDDLYGDDAVDNTVNQTALRESFRSLLVIGDGSGGQPAAVDSFFDDLIEAFLIRNNWTTDRSHLNIADPLWQYELFEVFSQVFLEVRQELSFLTGATFIKKFLNRTYVLPTKTMTVDASGTVLSVVSIGQFSPSLGRFDTAISFDTRTRFLNASRVTWFNNATTLPADFPLCGLHGEDCWYTQYHELPAALGAVVGLIIVGTAVTVAIIRKKSNRDRISSLFHVRDAMQSPGGTPSDETNVWLGEKEVFAKAIKSGTIKRNFMQNTKFCRTLLTIEGIHHKYIAAFHGILVQNHQLYAVYETSEKGTIRAFLQRNRHFLDVDLKTYWVTNILEALVYIHKSPLKGHKMLSSEACLVDARYTIKVLLTGYAHLVQCAASHGAPSATCDTYQTGRIVAELFVTTTDSDGCIVVDNSTTPPPIHNLIMECLAEKTDEKLRNGVLSRRLHYFARVKHNIVEMMLMRLDQHAQHLEAVVTDRTEMLIKETQKVDHLLHQMFPSGLVLRLRNRETVEAEMFECATVIFSDIPAFTDLATVLSPMAIVQLLNLMHSKFDEIVGRFDVYKVETISDSYVVVSGVPNRNGTSHASEQCALALHLLPVAQIANTVFLDTGLLAVRVGINSGPVAAAVVGLRMPRYCLFGDAMNTASRMESHGAG
ncbi:atrial natriuretic peptide receptor 1-like [Paramacrobiotus metropolitanus]|uniref:atrial natriuretic peptide receptor 1-like n=1 Tax=Paramacrobiotus metropolitanus TaxID=2943436 RepID=UPI0024462806|nr:atrial natriuretic peptide receptor 1-like [Paramacrobiotus metropolitanus]